MSGRLLLPQQFAPQYIDELMLLEQDGLLPPAYLKTVAKNLVLIPNIEAIVNLRPTILEQSLHLLYYGPF